MEEDARFETYSSEVLPFKGEGARLTGDSSLCKRLPVLCYAGTRTTESDSKKQIHPHSIGKTETRRIPPAVGYIRSISKE